MTDQEKLLADIEAYLSLHGMAASTFGARAVQDGKFVARLRAGKDVTLRTADRVRAFMAVPPEASFRPRRLRAARGTTPSARVNSLAPEARSGGRNLP